MLISMWYYLCLFKVFHIIYLRYTKTWTLFGIFFSIDFFGILRSDHHHGTFINDTLISLGYYTQKDKKKTRKIREIENFNWWEAAFLVSICHSSYITASVLYLILQENMDSTRSKKERILKWTFFWRIYHWNLLKTVIKQKKEEKYWLEIWDAMAPNPCRRQRIPAEHHSQAASKEDSLHWERTWNIYLSVITV